MNGVLPKLPGTSALSEDAPAAVAASRGSRIPSLDGLRGLAIIGVVLFHIDYFLGRAGFGVVPNIFHHLVSFGWAGVDLFFVLSGFLITGILYDTRNQPGYLRVFYSRRALRIFPVYYFFLLCFFGLGPVLLTATGHGGFIQHHIQPSTQVFAWLYLVNWFGGARHLTYFSDFIKHFWSLAVEEQFYLLWPFVVGSLDRSRLKRVSVALIVVSLVSRCALELGGFGAAAATWTICRMDGFAVGGLIAMCVRSREDWSALTRWAAVVTPVCAVAFGMMAMASVLMPLTIVSLDTFGPTILALLFGGCVVSALGSSSNAVSVVGSWPPLRVAGKYSYGTYVWHQPIVLSLNALNFRPVAIVKVLHSEGLTLLVANAVPVACAALVAFCSWHLLEKRFLQLKDHPALEGFVRSAEGPLSLAPPSF
jgi:peptidoglycan/LPS O-acetylase OafA/YrhL